MKREDKIRLIKIAVAGALFIAALFTQNEYVKFCLFLAAYITVGYCVIIKAIRNIFSGQIFDENFLMAIASIGALVLSEYAEGVAVILFYAVGELFEDMAVAKSRKNISALMNIRPDSARVITQDTSIILSPSQVKTGDIVEVHAGEKIPLDGIIEQGEGAIDTSMLTGESVPREVCKGDKVSNGCINLNTTLLVRVTGTYENSTVAKILKLYEDAGAKKAKYENFITKFARYYTPFVVISAVIMGIFVPLVFSLNFMHWVYLALTFLVISCPCALVISVPLSFYSGIGLASKNGVLIKGSTYIDVLSKTKYVVLDKTGTITTGKFSCEQIDAINCTEDELIRIAAHVQSFSNHPIAKSVAQLYKGEINKQSVEKFTEVFGKGVCAVVDGENVNIGNKKYMQELNVQVPEIVGKSVMYICVDGKYMGNIIISDTIKKESKQAIERLKNMGIEVIMLTGDNYYAAKNVAEQVGIDKYYYSLLPQDKVEKLSEIIALKSKGETVVFAGDGINDAPALALADAGIAMGKLGSDAAIEAADAVVMSDDLSKLVKGIAISKKTMNKALSNIVFALAVKAVVLVLGVMSLASMWAAVFADVGVSVIAIINAVSLLRYKIK